VGRDHAEGRGGRVRGLAPFARTPIGEGSILASDEDAFREAGGAASGARLLPSGDAYLLAGDRELLVADDDRRRSLWPPSTVWPGGVMVDGELVGTWRRAHAAMTVDPWRRLSRAAREAVEAEAAGLPIPGVEKKISVRWNG
jgi:DNA glycosylase AlkZ-like